MRISILFLLIIFIISSCDPVRRHARIVEKYPYVHKDSTFTEIDTIIVYKEKIKIDTFAEIKKLTDTFIVEKERAKVKLVKINDTIFVDVNCPEDTFFVEVEKETIIRHSENHAKRKSYFLVGLILGAIAVALIKISR